MKKKSHSKKKLVLSIVGVMLLLAAALVAGMLVRNMTQPEGKGGDSQEAEGPKLPAKVEEVQNLRGEGNDEATQKKIEESLASATDNETRYMLYLQQGHIAYDKQDWNAAAASYTKAEKQKETAEVAELLANVYAEAGKKAQAVDYFKKALRLTSTENPRYDTIKAGYENRIKMLGGQP